MRTRTTEIWVEKTGLYTSVQDKGRSGHQAFGVPVGGVMDRRAAAQANWLVGRPAGQAVLEITMQGPVLRFEGELQIALTGADLSAVINGQAVPMYQTLQVARGDVLSFGRRKNGCRTYLALGGHWQLPEWLGSAAAFRMGQQLWPPGSVLDRGDRLSVTTDGATPERRIDRKERPYFSRQLTVRIWPGPEFDWLPEPALHYLTTHAFQLSNECNRMGYRLRESLPGYQPVRELISSGIVPGTIQLPPSGRPLILLADAQTTGGYPRIAIVADRDLDDLGQLTPGDQVRFLLAD